MRGRLAKTTVAIAQADDVVDERTLANLLRRIGSQTRHRVFETEAVVEVEARVRLELLFGTERQVS